MISLQTILYKNNSVIGEYLSKVKQGSKSVDVTFVGSNNKTISVEQSHQFDSDIHFSALTETEYKDGLNYSSFCIEPVHLVDNSNKDTEKAYVFYINDHEVYTVVNHTKKSVKVRVEHKKDEKRMDTDTGNFYDAIAECNVLDYYFIGEFFRLSDGYEKVLETLSPITFNEGKFHDTETFELVGDFDIFEKLEDVTLYTEVIDESIFESAEYLHNLKKFFIRCQHGWYSRDDIAILTKYIPEFFEWGTSVTLLGGYYTISLTHTSEGRVFTIFNRDHRTLHEEYLRNMPNQFIELADYIDMEILVQGGRYGKSDNAENICGETLNKLRSIKYIFDKTDMYDLSINYSNRSSAKSAASVCQ